MILLNHIRKFQQGGYMSLSVPERKKYITNYFIQQGYNPIQTAAIVGNLQAENDTFDPSRNETGNGIGYGIAQWSFDRRKDIEKVKNHNTIDAQLNFLNDELKGNRKGVWTNNVGGKNAFFNSKDVKEATYIFRKDFERPSEKYAHDARRYKNAQDVASLIDPNYKFISTETPTQHTNPNPPQPKNFDVATLSYAEIYEQFNSQPSVAAEMITLKRDYEDRLEGQAQQEQQQIQDYQKQQLLQAQQQKETLFSLLSAPSNQNEKYNNQILQESLSQSQPFRFSTNWFNPQQTS